MYGESIYINAPDLWSYINGPVWRATMLTRGLILNTLRQAKVLTLKNRINSHYQEILSFHPELIQMIVESTNYLRYNACIKSRIHCLLLGVSDQPYCSCGNLLKMRTSGRFAGTFPSHCSNACTSNDRTVVDKRKQTNLKRYGTVTPLLKADVGSINYLVILNTQVIQ
jgi:hypothetical protein